MNKAAIIGACSVPMQYSCAGFRQTVTGATLNHSECALVYSDNSFTAVAEGDGLQVNHS